MIGKQIVAAIAAALAASYTVTGYTVYRAFSGTNCQGTITEMILNNRNGETSCTNSTWTIDCRNVNLQPGTLSAEMRCYEGALRDTTTLPGLTPSSSGLSSYLLWATYASASDCSAGNPSSLELSGSGQCITSSDSSSRATCSGTSGSLVLFNDESCLSRNTSLTVSPSTNQCTTLSTGRAVRFSCGTYVQTGSSTTTTTTSSTSGTSTSSSASPTTRSGDDTGDVKPSGSSTPIGAIVGGVVGGLALIVLIVIAVLWNRHKNKQIDSLKRASVLNVPAPAPQGAMPGAPVYGYPVAPPDHRGSVLYYQTPPQPMGQPMYDYQGSPVVSMPPGSIPMGQPQPYGIPPQSQAPPQVIYGQPEQK